jgi:hypothetical protein
LCTDIYIFIIVLSDEQQGTLSLPRLEVKGVVMLEEAYLDLPDVDVASAVTTHQQGIAGDKAMRARGKALLVGTR